MHELAHLVGYADTTSGLMSETLTPGIRLATSVDQVSVTNSAEQSPSAAASSSIVGLLYGSSAVPAAGTSAATATQPASAGAPLNKVSLGQPIIPVAAAAAPALTPNGAPTNVAVDGASAPAPQISASVQSSDDSIPSVASLEPGVHEAEVISSDPPVVEAHSSRPSDQASAKPTINWDSAFDVVADSSSVSAVGSPEWLDDFFNHLGQSEAQRNPNAGIRLRPSPAVVAAVNG
jgi:hypothetical protein